MAVLPKIMQGKAAKTKAPKAEAEEPEPIQTPPEEAPAPEAALWENPFDIPARVNAARRVLRWAFWVGGWYVTHTGEHRLSATWHVSRTRNHAEQRKTVSLDEKTTPKELARILLELE
ncbi:MAG: hypothetical protein IT365_11825 [Candidatus Hydrogenedentes bacterium]|nr:hypothetical protein [Candidatus Hydrogenedentota bacterium]